MNSRDHFRPKTARAVAGRADSFSQFGLNLRDWFHELRKISSRSGLAAALAHRPPRLRGRFAGGEVADAFLAAQVAQLCRQASISAPKWTRHSEYILDDPWFASPGANASLRALLIRDADEEFKNRNLFTVSELVWVPKRGRPTTKTSDQKRETARLRKRRWRVLRHSRGLPPC